MMMRAKPSIVFKTGLSAVAGSVSGVGFELSIAGSFSEFSEFSNRNILSLVRRLLHAIRLRLNMMPIIQAEPFSAFSAFSEALETRPKCSTWYILFAGDYPFAIRRETRISAD
jgi:hypothetical protein